MWGNQLALGCATPRLSKSSGCLMGSSMTCSIGAALSEQQRK